MELVNPATIAEIVHSIFSTMMDVDVSVADTPMVPSGDRLTASVCLEGAWNGAVSLQCGQRQACEFAGRFLAIDPPEDVDDDVRDVLGEIANMIGGNMKSSMGTEVRLALPTVINGSDYEVRVCGSSVQDTVGFQYFGGQFWVTVLRKTESGTGSHAALSATQAVM